MVTAIGPSTLSVKVTIWTLVTTITLYVIDIAWHRVLYGI